MKRSVLLLFLVLLTLTVSAAQADTPALSFAAKKLDVNGGFAAEIGVKDSAAPEEDLPVTLTDDRGGVYEGMIPAGKTAGTVTVPTAAVSEIETLQLSLSGQSMTLRVFPLTSVQFYQRVNIGYTGKKMAVKVTCKQPKNVLPGNNVFQLRDQNGLVLAEKAWKNPNQALNFSFDATPELEGRHDFSVWLGDYCVSTSEFGSITDAKRKVIQKINTTEPYMAVTIDCNWYNSHAIQILDVLDKHNVKCTFFMTGNYLRLFPETAKEIQARGHEIANHSNTHQRQSTLGEYTKMKEVLLPVKEAVSVLGVHPRLFRPPYGDFDKVTTAIARGAGMEVCLWTIDSKDWDPTLQTKKEVIIKRAKKDVTPGTIVLFHLDGYNTYEILDEVIGYYQGELGLKCVPVTELMALEGRELPPLPEGVDDGHTALTDD